MKFKKTIILILSLSLALGILTGCSTKEEERGSQLLISAAASLTDVIEELGDLYKDENKDIELSYSFASSGALQAQIEEGAPVDIFISAAEKQMDALEEKDLILQDTRKTILVNNLVLINSKDSKLEINNFMDILNSDVERIGMGDPASVPVGQYSQEVFNNLDIEGELEGKLIYGNDVRTVLAWVASNEVDLGLVYATDAYTSEDVNIIASAPEGSHKPITYPVAVVKWSKEVQASKDFIDFLSTDQAREIFEKYGFTSK